MVILAKDLTNANPSYKKLGVYLPEQPYIIASLAEAQSYHDTSKFGFFSVCYKPKVVPIGGSKWKIQQKTYPLSELPRVLEQCLRDRADYTIWISQGEFSRRNRRKINLASIATAFVDFDYYTVPALQDKAPEHVLELILRRCDDWKIPFPSIVEDSGCGLYAKWIHERLPKKALPRWEHLELCLCEIFEDLGADKNARDVSRILKPIGTLNHKNGNEVKVLWVNQEAFYEAESFNELIHSVHRSHVENVRGFEFDENYKANRKKKSDRRQGNKQKNKLYNLKPHQIGFTTNSLNWSRVCDILKLVELREGDIGDGMRELAAFWTCNFFALRYCNELALKPLEMWQEMFQCAKRVLPQKDWPVARIRAKVSNLYQRTLDTAAGKTVEYEKNGKVYEYPPLFTPTNQRLISDFKITDTEMRQLQTIITKNEVLRRELERKQSEQYKEEHRNRNRDPSRERKQAALAAKGAQPRAEYQQAAENKKTAVIELRKQGLSVRNIAEIMKISKTAVSRYLQGL